MNSLERVLGEACRILLPVSERVYLGDTSSPVALCTLASMRLLDEVVRLGVLNHAFAAGRLLSENSGIDALITFIAARPTIRVLLLCGVDSRGHRAGHSLLQLHKNGIDDAGRIIDSESPNPVLRSPPGVIEVFRGRVTIADHRREEDPPRILRLVRILCQ